MGKVIQIREIGDPILEKISQEVDIKNINKEILELIEDLKTTLIFWKRKRCRNCSTTARC